MLPKDSDQNWEAFARSAPYFGVLSDEKFAGQELDDVRAREFFLSGEQHVSEVLANIQNHVDQRFTFANCLDFGCGVGRIALPLAARFQSVTGTDVSPTMLAEARRNAEQARITNLELVPSDDDLSELQGPFDLVHSFIVLQHIPVARGEKLFARLVQLIRPGGIGALHLTFHWDASKWSRFKAFLRERIPVLHGALNLLKGRAFNHPYMLMQCYDLNRIFACLQRNRCTVFRTDFTNHDHHHGVMLYFQKGL
jgi:SAM-dependent methyltransferase